MVAVEVVDLGAKQMVALREDQALDKGAQNTEGKLFLGGLDNATTKESLQNYCLQW